MKEQTLIVLNYTSASVLFKSKLNIKKPIFHGKSDLYVCTDLDDKRQGDLPKRNAAGSEIINRGSQKTPKLKTPHFENQDYMKPMLLWSGLPSSLSYSVVSVSSSVT